MITVWQTASTQIIPSFGKPEWIPGNSADYADKSERSDANKKLRVIVIDDETLIAETVVEILKEEGFEATGVSNGASAIELAKTWHPDIVLSDVIMPGLNGIETGTKILEVSPNCRIILFSGQAATVDLLEKARLQGRSFDILAKPIKPQQLISVIRGNTGYPS
jgi:DNA-binding NtrC family response regulator